MKDDEVSCPAVKHGRVTEVNIACTTCVYLVLTGSLVAKSVELEGSL